MELILNILWLLLALSGVALWRTSWAHQPRTRRHAPWREWTALACALVFLFFVVSLTDDLHAELVVLEDCATSRRQVICLSAAQQAQQPDHFPTGPGAAILPAPPQATDFAAAPLFESAKKPSPSHPRQQSHPGRAPPTAI
jgi:hypothetical protein